MGNGLSTARKQLANPWNAQGGEEEAREALKLFRELWKLQAHQFERDSERYSRWSNLRPTSIISRYDFQEIPSSSKDMWTLLKKKIDRFSHGDVAWGIHAMAKGIVENLIHGPKGVFRTVRRAVLSRDKYGCISRLDIIFGVYRFTSKTFRAGGNPVIACRVVQSKVEIDFESFTPRKLRRTVREMFHDSKPEAMDSIYRELASSIFSRGC